MAKAVSDGVPGAFMETGVWRGGLCFLVAKALELVAARERRLLAEEERERAAAIAAGLHAHKHWSKA